MSVPPELPRYDANAWPHGFHNLWTESSMRNFARDTAAFWRCDALEKAAQIAERYGSPEIASDIRSLSPTQPEAKEAREDE